MAHKIFIFVPAFGQQITATTFLTSHAIMQQLAAKGISGGISTLSFPDIAELRAMATTIWYDTMPDCRYLLFIDADMGFPPEIVTDMLLHDEGIVGTIYRQRKEPVSWAGSGNGQPLAERRSNFMVVEGVGFGCTMIRRDVIAAMIERMPQIVDTRMALHPAAETLRAAGTSRLIRAFEKLDLPERGVVSEDLSFCIRAAACGFKTWAGIGYNIHHVGPHDYNGRYLDGIEATQVAQEQARQAALAAPQPAALPIAEPMQMAVPAIPIGEAAQAAPIAAVRLDMPKPPREFVVTEKSAGRVRRMSVKRNLNGRGKRAEHGRRAGA